MKSYPKLVILKLVTVKFLRKTNLCLSFSSFDSTTGPSKFKLERRGSRQGGEFLAGAHRCPSGSPAPWRPNPPSASLTPPSSRTTPFYAVSFQFTSSQSSSLSVFALSTESDHGTPIFCRRSLKLSSSQSATEIPLLLGVIFTPDLWLLERWVY